MAAHPTGQDTRIDPRDGDAFAEWRLPAFSTAERDRRWSRVRALMRRDGIDVLVGFNTTGTHGRGAADVRYLTQLGNASEEAGVVFPLDGAVTAFTYGGGRWPAGDWVGETARAGGSWARAIVETVRGLAAGSATLGVLGLSRGVLSSVRQPDGAVPYAAMLTLQEAFPEARIVSATDLLGEARYVKSTEELDFLRAGMRIAEAARAAMLATARPGVREPVVMAEMLRAEVTAGGSLPVMLGWTSGPFGAAYHRLEQPTHRTLRDGDYLTVEIEGRWGGYVGHIDQSMTLGSVPAWAADAHRVALECYRECVAALRPGITFGELRAAARRISRVDGAEGELILHGKGLGDDGPLVLAGRPDQRVDALEVREDTVFVVKPQVRYRGRRDVGHVGDTLRVTATGAERLGTFPIEDYAHA